MNEKYTLEELEAYLVGELAQSRKEELDLDIKTNLALQEDLEALKISREAIELAGWKSLISQNQNDFLSDRQENNVRSINFEPKSVNILLGRIAASLTLILVGFVAVLFFSVSPESITSKVLDYTIPVMRSAESNLETMEKAFQAEDFDLVISLSQIVTTYNPDTYFLIGLSYLEKENGAKAEEYFKAIESENLRTSENRYADQVDYYLVKSYLIQNNLAEAEAKMVKILEDENHTYHANFNQLDRLKIKILKIK